MIKAGLRAVWRIRVGEEERELDEMLIALLEGVKRTEKLAGAMRLPDISYRHAYNLLKRWGDFLGAPLVTMKQGRGTKLTPLGEQLLWAGRRVQSRLAPELDNLASEFTRGLAGALGRKSSVITVHASHDFAVALLAERLAESGQPVDLQSRGSFDALAALLKGECDVAGFHVADGAVGDLMRRRYAEGLAGRDIRLLALADRQQGLIVAKGNPRRIRRLADLARPGVRFVNRQRGSGTRALLEFLLNAAHVEREAIAGYGSEEITHSAVAALVAGRQVDAGFGLEAAASRFGLDFVPVAQERYYFAFDATAIAGETLGTFVAAATAPLMRALVDEMPGYRACEDSRLLTAAEAFAAEPAPAMAPVPAPAGRRPKAKG